MILPGLYDHEVLHDAGAVSVVSRGDGTTYIEPNTFDESRIPVSALRVAKKRKYQEMRDVLLRPLLRNYTAELGYVPGDITVPLANTLTSGLTSPPHGQESRISAFMTTGSAAEPFAVTHKSTGATSGAAAARWRMLIEADRGW